MSKTKEEAAARLLEALPLFRKAVSDASLRGLPQLGIIACNPDGSGQVLVRFDAGDLFEDLALVLGAAPWSEEESKKADTLAFLHRLTIAGPGH
jgi:hypothetical protein